MFFRFLPRFLVVWYADKARIKLVSTEEQILWANRMLECVSPNYEYTTGFLSYLEKKLVEWNQERSDLVSKISIMESRLNS